MTLKKETFKDYFERINRILLYINSNLGDNLDLKKLAEMSNFSLFHFHRIMRAYLGESLGEYIQRIRLETSHHLLRHTMEPVREIALKVGYDSPSSFNKAFMKRFGITPSSVRNRMGGSEFHFLNPFIKTIVMNPVVLKPKLVVLKEKKVVYVQSIGKYGDTNTSECWLTLVNFVTGQRLFSRQTEFIGICYDDPNLTEPERCRYDACITVAKEIKAEGEIGYMVLAGGRFAVFSYTGPYSGLGEIYNTIYREWLPGSGYTLRNIPCREKYLNDPRKVNPEKLITEIYIPVM